MPEWCFQSTNLKSPNTSCRRQSYSKPNPAFLSRLTLVSLSGAAWNWCSRHTGSSVISQNHGFLSLIQYKLYFLIRKSNFHSSFKSQLKCYSSWEAFPSAPGRRPGPLDQPPLTTSCFLSPRLCFPPPNYEHSESQAVLTIPLSLVFIKVPGLPLWFSW